MSGALPAFPVVSRSCRLTGCRLRGLAPGGMAGQDRRGQRSAARPARVALPVSLGHHIGAWGRGFLGAACPGGRLLTLTAPWVGMASLAPQL